MNHELKQGQVWYNGYSDKIFYCTYHDIQRVFIFCDGGESFCMHEFLVTEKNGWILLSEEL